MLHLKSISFSYNSQPPALYRISFRLNKRFILGIAGSSGSGKSTLLNAIYGLIDVSSGTIWFKKEKVTGPAFSLIPGHAQMRLAGQSHQLQDSLPVIDQIKYKLLRYQSGFREQKAMELLSLVGLENKRSRMPRQLSGGQQQLVNLCCALAEEPELLLLDEPFNNLDQHAKKRLKEYLLGLRNNQNISIIIVSHDPTDLLSVSDEIIVLQNGRKIQHGKPEKVFFEPKSEYIAGLFGEYNKIKSGVKSKFIRPSQIQISIAKKTGFTEAKVISCQFNGNYYLNELIHPKYGILFVSSKEKWKEKKIFIKI